MDRFVLTLVQSNLAWQQAPANREILAGMLEEAQADTDLIILPEMFTSAFSMESGAIAEPWPGETVGWMQAIAAKFDAAVCGSVAVLDQGNKYNRLVFVTPAGEIQFYDKRHLFRMLGEDKRYAWGSNRFVAQWRGWRIYPLVCYDLRFPVWCRNTPELDYDLMLFVANWPAPRNHHWQALLRARAVENLAVVAGVNRLGRDGNGLDYAGHSMVIGASGEELLDAGEEAGCHTVTISKQELDAYRKAFPAFLDADAFELK